MVLCPNCKLSISFLDVSELEFLLMYLHFIFTFASCIYMKSLPSSSYDKIPFREADNSLGNVVSRKVVPVLVHKVFLCLYFLTVGGPLGTKVLDLFLIDMFTKRQGLNFNALNIVTRFGSIPDLFLHTRQ